MDFKSDFSPDDDFAVPESPSASDGSDLWDDDNFDMFADAPSVEQPVVQPQSKRQNMQQARAVQAQGVNAEVQHNAQNVQGQPMQNQSSVQRRPVQQGGGQNQQQRPVQNSQGGIQGSVPQGNVQGQQQRRQPNQSQQGNMQGRQPAQGQQARSNYDALTQSGNQPRRQMQTPEQLQQNAQQAASMQQAANVQQVQQNGKPQKKQKGKANQQQAQNTQPAQEGKKKGGKGKFILLFIVVLIIGAVAYLMLSGSKEQPNSDYEPVAVDYNTSGRYAYDSLHNALINFDAVALDTVVGAEDGDSYLAQEWAYVNAVPLREEFLHKVGSLVSFNYPVIETVGADGTIYTDTSYMNNGEAAIVTIPDYVTLVAYMDEDSDYIRRMFTSSGYSEEDYQWYDEMANLFCQWFVDRDTIPTKDVELVLPLALSVEGIPYIKEDIELDNLLFASDDFHAAVSRFAQLCLGWTGLKDEEYIVQEEQHNPEYDEWYAIFIKYYEEDGGKFRPSKSKWEPWYLYDENNQVQYDENGERIVRYYSVKDEDGNDWIAPDETIIVDVIKVRQVDDPWVEETGILYNWCGTWYVQNAYKGKGDTVFRVGDGSIGRPAGIGTSIITKVLCDDGRYHDVRVTLEGYWKDEDAINYAERFDTRNRGFTTTSVVRLIVFEIIVENLEKESITFTSEMTLTDKNSNISSRTGTLYGFTESVTLQGGESRLINDWASSTELDLKYVCWGKSFGRTYSMIYFDCLAGTGVVPSYSAYDQFIRDPALLK